MQCRHATWQPAKRGQVDIRIDREGRWFHEGDEIKRQPLIDLFATLLRKEGGDYFLVTPVEQMQIAVEDSPFVVVDMDVRGHGENADVLFTTNVGDYDKVTRHHPVHRCGPAVVFSTSDLPQRALRSQLLGGGTEGSVRS